MVNLDDQIKNINQLSKSRQNAINHCGKSMKLSAVLTTFIIGDRYGDPNVPKSRVAYEGVGGYVQGIERMDMGDNQLSAKRTKHDADHYGLKRKEANASRGAGWWGILLRYPLEVLLEESTKALKIF